MHKGEDAASHTPDPHAVSDVEAKSYYACLPSKPKLVYRTGKEAWSPRQERRLSMVFDHPIEEIWNDFGHKVVEVLDAYDIWFTTIDLVRFNIVEVDESGEEITDPVTSPATIWVGVKPGSTSATAAHGAAQDILALLGDNEITDVDIEFRESLHILL